MAIRVLITLIGCLLSAVSVANNEFVIGAGDTIVIEVYNENDLKVQAKVPKSGVLRIPLLGDIPVVGKTPAALSAELEAAYFDGYLVDPSVSVMIVGYRPFYIRGAVEKPGSYSFEFDLTIDQAIAVAGGLTDRASSKEWFVIRGPDKKRLKVASDARVFPGDIIEIKESIF